MYGEGSATMIFESVCPRRNDTSPAASDRLRRSFGNDGRVRHVRRRGVAHRDQVVPEAVDRLGHHPRVALAAPLAVGQVVEAGALLQTDGRRNCGVEQPVGGRLVDAAGFAVQDQLPHPDRPGQAPHHERGERLYSV